jgi:hypothetical protein
MRQIMAIRNTGSVPNLPLIYPLQQHNKEHVNMQHLEIKGKILTPRFLAGEVIEINIDSETHVSGGGGSTYTNTYNGSVSGYTSIIRSTITKKTRIWLKTPIGDEVELKLPGEISARVGHKIVFSMVFEGDKGYNFALTNLTTKTTTEFIDQSEMMDFFNLKIPNKLTQLFANHYQTPLYPAFFNFSRMQNNLISIR